MIIDLEDYLEHFGTPRHSGRYPYGSGGDDGSGSQNKDFLGTVADLRRQGLSETDIAQGFGMTTTQLRAAKAIEKNKQKQADIAMAQRLKDKGYSNVAIGTRMNIRESSVRALLAPGVKDKHDVLQATSSMLREQVAKKRYIDIGSGVENHLGISSTKLASAVAVLKEEGYVVHKVQIDQLGTSNKTIVKVLAPAGTTYRDIVSDKTKINQIQQVDAHSTDGGRTFLGMQPPIHIDTKRVGVKYAEDGGAQADGLIYVRPGVKDLSLGSARYAQVRIAVGGTHYLKGMAVYKDDLPPGTDLVFNTNKSNTGNKLDAMKELKRDASGRVDPDNPFGSAITAHGQVIDPHSNRVSSAMNKVNEEGDWRKWSKTLSSQMLSKQSPQLAKTQLDMTFEAKKNDLDSIMQLTNPAVRRKLLMSLADDADSSSVHLKAAALPRQASHVIMPIPSMKSTEIYAPNYENGTRVVLIRHPHGGTFEIPELVVNNRHPDAKRLLGSNAPDAVGISSKVAERLSGADFDGDTVLVIPNNTGRVKTSPALAGLKNFDPKSSYPAHEGMKVMDARTKGFEMGDISNLITDMTIRGANTDELARAVRHSMVVIDAEKHKLNYKQSAVDNGIANLKRKYQGKANAGASTLVSRASSRIDVAARKMSYRIDPATGKKVYTPTGESWTNSKGQTIVRTQRSKKLAETDNAHTLSSGTVIEKVYADHSNRLKDLANQARLAAVQTTTTPYSASARAAYSKEVASLDAKLQLALRNRPLERRAQVLAHAVVEAKRKANPDMDSAELKKIKGLALTEARLRTGAGKQHIDITPDEWSAIQAGAITNNRLTNILDNANLDRVKELATPRTKTVMSSAKSTRARAMIASGYSQAEVAAHLGVSVSTLANSLS
jgi:DNA-binding CsgD family transcriptional regulator/biotin operon repressor